MPNEKLPRNVKPDRLLRALLKLGFQDYRGKGSHRRLKHPDGRWTQIPLHPGPVPTGTLKCILQQAGISSDELDEVY